MEEKLLAGAREKLLAGAGNHFRILLESTLASILAPALQPLPYRSLSLNLAEVRAKLKSAQESEIARNDSGSLLKMTKSNQNGHI